MGEITARLVEQNPENEAEIMKVLSSHSSHSSKYQEKRDRDPKAIWII